MTTFAVPPAGSLAWREIHPTPPNARLYTVGPYCPLDETVLRERADGFGCPVCLAAWDFHGLAGRWLDKPVVRWRPSALLVLFGLAGCAIAAAALAVQLGVLGEHLVCVFAVVLAVAAIAVVLGALTGRTRDWARYRHNRVTEAHTSVDQTLGGSAVSDER